MREKFVTITVGEREFRLLFSLEAMAIVAERFGSVEEMTEKLEKDYVLAIRVVPWLFTLLANQGEKLKDGDDAKLITESWAGSNIMPYEIKTILNACHNALEVGLKLEHEPSENETVDVVLEEIRKNGEGAEE